MERRKYSRRNWSKKDNPKRRSDQMYHFIARMQILFCRKRFAILWHWKEFCIMIHKLSLEKWLNFQKEALREAQKSDIISKSADCKLMNRLYKNKVTRSAPSNSNIRSKMDDNNSPHDSSEDEINSFIQFRIYSNFFSKW
jgi:hypothetical protein